MIASMTGFARREFAGPFGTLVCEIRSVNHRFLDATLRLPDSCRALEPELRQALARELRRGKVDCTLQQRSVAAAAARIEIDQAALDRLLARVNELAAAVPGRSQVDLIDLLRFPGILREDASDPETLMQNVRSVFAEALAELARARVREGGRLAALISQRCATLGGHDRLIATAIAGGACQDPAALRGAAARARRAGGPGARRAGNSADAAALRCRRGTGSTGWHLVETARTLAGDEPAGRRLDFLMQEFNREANTLSSKSQDLETTRSAVEMKV